MARLVLVLVHVHVFDYDYDEDYDEDEDGDEDFESTKLGDNAIIGYAFSGRREKSQAERRSGSAETTHIARRIGQGGDEAHGPDLSRYDRFMKETNA